MDFENKPNTKGISYFYEVSRKGKFTETESTLEFTEN